MKRSRKRFAALAAASVLAVALTVMFSTENRSPDSDVAEKMERPAPTMPAAAGATEEPDPMAPAEADASQVLTTVSVRGEVITAHLATVPESVWNNSAPVQPPYAVPAPSYDRFPHASPTPGVPIINSALRPAEAAPPDRAEK